MMHVVAMAYMVAIGLEQASCALVGQEIGKGDVPNAKLYYRAFEIITTIILICTSTLVYLFSDALISIFTTEKQINAELQKLMWVFSLNTFPDCYKGMLKGIIKALGIQTKAAYINISGHWCINITLQLYLGFHLNMGLEGIWIAKVINEFYIAAMYIIVLRVTDWDDKARIAAERQSAKLQEDEEFEMIKPSNRSRASIDRKELMI